MATQTAAASRGAVPPPPPAPAAPTAPTTSTGGSRHLLREGPGHHVSLPKTPSETDTAVRNLSSPAFQSVLRANPSLRDVVFRGMSQDTLRAVSSHSAVAEDIRSLLSSYLPDTTTLANPAVPDVRTRDHHPTHNPASTPASHPLRTNSEVRSALPGASAALPASAAPQWPQPALGAAASPKPPPQTGPHGSQPVFKMRRTGHSNSWHPTATNLSVKPTSGPAARDGLPATAQLAQVKETAPQPRPVKVDLLRPDEGVSRVVSDIVPAPSAGAQARHESRSAPSTSQDKSLASPPATKSTGMPGAARHADLPPSSPAGQSRNSIWTAERRERLSAEMKARWASGIMDHVHMKKKGNART